MTYSANIFHRKTTHSLPITLSLQLLSWSAQLLGHYVFEHRSPALLDNLFQAFLLAPMFVFMEFLFAMGYRPALLKRTREKTKTAITTWKMGSMKKEK